MDNSQVNQERDVAVMAFKQFLNVSLSMQRFRLIQQANPQFSYHEGTGVTAITWREGLIDCCMSFRAGSLSLAIHSNDHESLNNSRKSREICPKMTYLQLPVTFNLPSPNNTVDFRAVFTAALEKYITATLHTVKQEIAEFRKIL